MVTLFTFNRAVWQFKQKDIIEKFGYYSEKDKGRHCIIQSILIKRILRGLKWWWIRTGIL